eukprot:15433011-Alexandrium_andersonii.AAC.1
MAMAMAAMATTLATARGESDRQSVITIRQCCCGGGRQRGAEVVAGRLWAHCNDNGNAAKGMAMAWWQWQGDDADGDGDSEARCGGK